MLERKYIKIPRINNVFENKDAAVSTIKQFVETNLSDFKDGESILVKFIEDGKIISSHVFININNNVVSLSFSLDSDETLTIVETENEPDNKDAIWVTETDERDVTIDILKNQVEMLSKKLDEFKFLVDKHEYALTHTLSGGDFMTNSMKNSLSNQYEQEKPYDAEDEKYAKDDFVVVDFDLLIGNTSLNYYTTEGKLYKWQYYHLKPRYYNKTGEIVDINPLSGITLYIESSREDVAIAQYRSYNDKWFIYGNISGATTISAEVVTDEGLIINKEYPISIKYNQEIDYEEYYEPNVRHVLIKTADTFEILSGNTDYLLLNEFVWCKGNNSLYFKAESSTGTIGLFKVNGGGVTPVPPEPTPEEGDISYKVNSTTGILEIVDKKEEKTVYVGEDGVLNLVGTFDQNGNLNLNSTTNITVDDGNLIFNNISIDDGYLILGDGYTVDEYGYIIKK